MTIVLIVAAIAAVLCFAIALWRGLIALRDVAAIAVLSLTKTLAARAARERMLGERIAEALEILGRRPISASIHHENAGLVAVHEMQAVVGWVTIAANSSARLQLEPRYAAWFKATAFRVAACVEGVPAAEQRVVIERCELNDAPLFHWSGVGISSDVFAAPPGHAVGVDIPRFSDLANKMPLRFVLRNENPHPVRVCIEAFGVDERHTGIA